MATFLSLPREIRDQIYEFVLKVNVVESHERTARRSSQVDTSLLSVSRQVHEETIDAFVKLNLFLGVTTSVVDVMAALSHLPEYTVTQRLADRSLFPSTSFSGISKYKHTFMEISIHPRRRTEKEKDEWYFLLVGEPQLAMFCRLVAYGNVLYRNFPPHEFLRIDVHMREPISSARLAGKAGIQLLLPIMKYWWGFPNFHLSGAVLELTRQKVERRVRGLPWTELDQLVAENRRRTDSVLDNTQQLPFEKYYELVSDETFRVMEMDAIFRNTTSGHQILINAPNYCRQEHSNARMCSYELLIKASSKLLDLWQTKVSLGSQEGSFPYKHLNRARLAYINYLSLDGPMANLMAGAVVAPTIVLSLSEIDTHFYYAKIMRIVAEHENSQWRLAEAWVAIGDAFRPIVTAKALAIAKGLSLSATDNAIERELQKIKHVGRCLRGPQLAEQFYGFYSPGAQAPPYYGHDIGLDLSPHYLPF